MSADPKQPPVFADIQAAHARIRDWIHRTPVHTCAHLDSLTGARVFFKCENLQRIGAFKIRGALNTIMQLTDEEAARGVVGHSSGNHAQAVARAARMRGIPAWLVMPEDAVALKVDAVRELGAEVVFCTTDIEDRRRVVNEIIERTGAASVHPFDDPRIIAGQGTAALEFHEDCPGLDILMTPVGGGGIVCGSIITTQAIAPDCRVIAAEPEITDDAWRSLRIGSPQINDNTDTICDGLKAWISELTFGIMRDYELQVERVSDDEITAAMRLFWERTNLIIEASSATVLAAALSGRMDIAGKRVGMILTGGNVDLDRLPWMS
ncbi:MAG: threonine/serine dehydratase [Planctomycetales bacterium]|nr:threonine/serine dehydratase [bacterium]UNM09778.1 MAG: threonine/serine dehydratase [Planctomycetales bacterium]